MLFIDLFLLRSSPFRHACENPRAPLYVFAFIITTCIVYGVLISAFRVASGFESQGVAAADVPFSLLVAINTFWGVFNTVLAHIGFTLVAWLMAKAIGGPGLMVVLYRATAYILPFVWLTMPFLLSKTTAMGTGVAEQLPFEWAYLPLAFIGTALAFTGLYHVFLVTQGRGPVRSGAAVALSTMFCIAVFLLFRQ